jgi:DNA polymerase-3 subunit chi
MQQHQLVHEATVNCRNENNFTELTMPKIDFYILSDPNPTSHLQLVCRLVEKAYKNRHRIYIHAHNKAQAYAVDELLWTYREDSFLPHNLYGEGPEPAPPIQIGFDAVPEKHRDILINISHDIPEFYTQFARILECVPNDAQLQELAREHYRLYRAQGHTITTHKLETVE